jgi:hypothetical protein
MNWRMSRSLSIAGLDIPEACGLDPLVIAAKAAEVKRRAKQEAGNSYVRRELLVMQKA